jgi:hypothetical protein
VFEPAQGAGGNALHAVAHEEGRADEKQRGGKTCRTAGVGLIPYEQQRNIMAERNDDRRGRGHEDGAQSNRAEPGPARRNRVFASDRVPDAHGRSKRDAERNHEQDGRDLQSDLMSGERGRADPAHEQRSRGEQPPLQQEAARDRQSDHKQLAHELPVRTPEATEHPIFLERSAGIANLYRSHAHGGIHESGREPGAEQVEVRQAEGTVDQGIGQKAIGGDGGERDRQRRLRTIDRSHEIAKGDEAPGRDHRPRQTGEVARGQRRRLG